MSLQGDVGGREFEAKTLGEYGRVAAHVVQGTATVLHGSFECRVLARG